LENVPISSAIWRIPCLILHLRTSAIVIEHTAIEPNDPDREIVHDTSPALAAATRIGDLA